VAVTAGYRRRAIMTGCNRDNIAVVAAAFREMQPRRSGTATATAARTVYRRRPRRPLLPTAIATRSNNQSSTSTTVPTLTVAAVASRPRPSSTVVKIRLRRPWAGASRCRRRRRRSKIRWRTTGKRFDTYGSFQPPRCSRRPTTTRPTTTVVLQYVCQPLSFRAVSFLHNIIF